MAHAIGIGDRLLVQSLVDRDAGALRVLDADNFAEVRSIAVPCQFQAFSVTAAVIAVDCPSAHEVWVFG
ncbi:hypothetical protein [Actinokineospora sp. UTMC 2448]|uniref:hypothetical protein n=1 Tax=Actinokineospora sp. UTMC 2448 TaxID=2268449 RepID=UPI0021648471|nr:hypothetical protein [Actinokineospora sp. UTMC 2448]UVS80912.1 hypothetical protein Actkin_04664 [Actinokineospora sp. UTMC 2448]